MITKRDQLWKGAFRILMPQFVQFHFPHKYAEIDWNKGVEYLDKELHKLQLSAVANNRIADVLVKLYLKTGEIVWVLLHIEIQGYPDEYFALRMHQMRYRIEDYFGVNPVMLCILTDDDPNFHPKEYVIDTWGKGCHTTFHTYKVMHNPPSEYPVQDTAVALIMEIAYNATQTKRLPDDKIMDLYIPIVRKLINEGYKKEEIKLIISFIEAHVKFANSENYRKFEKNIDTMVKYETTEDILALFDTEKRLKKLQFLEEQEDVMKANIEKLRIQSERELRNTQQARAKAEEARAKAEEERTKAEEERAKKDKSVLLMLNQGITIDLISRVVGITENEIVDIQTRYKDSNILKELM